jgi:lambda family phage portal protein
MNLLDRMILWFAPQWGQTRARARLLARHYESASVGRRTEGWSRRATDANSAASGATLALLRAQARDLVRNNPWARRGLRRIVSNTVGWGIQPKANGNGADRVMELWKIWGETTQCDSAGRLNFYGLQRLAMRTIVQSGEVLIRRRMRRLDDGLGIPMQLQILEPDFLDTSMDSMRGAAGGEIVQGVEFDQLGRRVAYWLFDKHPGGQSILSPTSTRIPAESILHVFDVERPGQVRGPSWFAAVDVRLHDFDEFEDATLVKQKIAACMAAFVTDLDGTGAAIAKPGTDNTTDQPTDTFEPGTIVSLPVGKSVNFSNPPAATDHQSYSTMALRGIAAGLGVTYEDLVGDYSQVNYSSARMSRLAHQGDVDDWRWNMLIPQLCVPAWGWMLGAMRLAGEDVEDAPAEWTPSPMPILEPALEGAAYQQLVRNGFRTWPQVIRELGYDPRDQLTEIEKLGKELDRRGIAFDCDPRRMTAAGNVQQVWLSGSIAPWPPKDPPALAAAPVPQPGAAAETDDETDDAGDDQSSANGAAH